MMKIMVYLTAAFLLCAAPVHAGINEDNFSVTLGGLGFISDGAQHQHMAPGMSVKLGYDFTKRLGIEGSFDYIQSQSTKNREYWTSRYAFRLDAVVNFLPESRFVPYVSGGTGFVYTDDMPGFKDRSRTDALLSLGGGAKLFLTDSLAVRADVRPVFTFGEGSAINTELMLGLTYHFGSTKTGATPVAREETPSETPLASGEELPEGAVSITNIRINGNVLEIMATGTITNYRFFSLAQPSRLVIDMANIANGTGRNYVPINKLGIASVRFGKHGSSLRVVLDAEQNELLPYKIRETDKGLKIIMPVP